MTGRDKERPELLPRSLRRVLWFVAIWAASVVAVGVLAEGLKRIILG